MISAKRIIKITGNTVNVYKYNENQPNEHYERIFGNDIVFVDEIPENEDFKDAWELSGSTVSVSMAKAKELKRNQLRTERASHFKETDTLMMETWSQRKDTTSIEPVNNTFVTLQKILLLMQLPQQLN